MYAQDYDEITIMYYRYLNPSALYWWGDLTQPYVKNYDCLKCPSGSWNYTYLRPPGLPNPLVCSYALPAIGVDANGVAVTQIAGSSMATIQDVAGTILLTESNRSEIYTGGTPNYTLRQVIDGGGSTSGVALRHMDGFVVGFCDGHAKWLKESKPGMWTSKEGD